MLATSDATPGTLAFIHFPITSNLSMSGRCIFVRFPFRTHTPPVHRRHWDCRFSGSVATMETTTVCAGSKVLSTRRGGLCVCIGVERKSQTATPPPGTAWLHSTHVQPLPAKLGAFPPCARLCVCATAQSKARTPKDSQRRIPGMMMLGTLCSRRSDDDQQRA